MCAKGVYFFDVCVRTSPNRLRLEYMHTYTTYMHTYTHANTHITPTGAALTIDAPEIAAPPRQLDVTSSNLDTLNWNQLIVGLDRYAQYL
jgi:hypothetical protein